jgi:hypothetical protein
MAVSKYEAFDYQNPMKLIVVRPVQDSNLGKVEEASMGSNSSLEASIEFSPRSKKIGRPIPQFDFQDFDSSDKQHPSSKSPHGIRFFYLSSPHIRL